MFKNLNLDLAFGLKLPIQERVNLAKIGNYQGIDLDIIEADRIVKAQSSTTIKQLIQENELRFGGWYLPICFDGEERVYRKGLQKLRKYAQIAKDVDCKTAYTWIIPYSNLPYKTNLAFHLKRLKPIAKILDENDCSLAIEFVGTANVRAWGKYEFIYDLDGATRLCEQIGEENVGLLLDSWHWYTSQGTIEQIRALKRKQVLYVHVNDAPPNIPIREQIERLRCLPGETGVIDLCGFLDSLCKIGYDGPVTPEPLAYSPLMSLIFLLRLPFTSNLAINRRTEHLLTENFWNVITRLHISPKVLLSLMSFLRRLKSMPALEVVKFSSKFIDEVLTEARCNK